MRFLFGLVVGAIGMWAYRGRKVQSLTSSAPEPMQQVFNKAAQQINEVVHNDQVRQIASTVQDKVLRTNAPQPEKRGDQSPAPSASKIDWPLPGSDGPAPGPSASGFAQPIEASERASGVGPGNPTPTEKAQASKPSDKEDPQ